MRIVLIKIFFLVSLLAIVGRLFYWQVVKAEVLQSRAESQYFADTKIEAIRGNIFYSDGSLLVSSNPSFTLYAMPKVIPNFNVENAYLLAKILATDVSKVDEKAKEILSQVSKDFYWVSLQKNVTSEQKKEIEKLNLKGIGFDQGNSRFYPEGSSSAHILGFMGSDAKGVNKGYFGLEGFYDGELKGIPGRLKHEKDALGLPILIGNFLSSDVKNGKDLVLSIDRYIQFTVEEALKSGMEKYGAKAASAVIMDPKSGEILALAAFPSYHPAKYFSFPKEYFKNPIVADQYEPGSTFKVLVMAAAMNEDLVKPESICDICSGPISLGGYTIRTWNNKYYSNTSMKDVIVHSDNTGMVFVGKKLGIDKFYQYMDNFGFGKATGIDLQDESSPELRDKDQWKEIDLATASFGQGIAVTPIQMVAAVGALASGGNLMEPHLVKKILDGEDAFEIKPKVVRKVIKESSALTIKEIMVAASEEGESKFLNTPGFKIAGKTGTAQIPLAGHYMEDKTIASFVGFAPADDPKFVMLVRYIEPSSSIFGSETAAPTFYEIAKKLFLYFKIAPQE